MKILRELLPLLLLSLPNSTIYEYGDITLLCSVQNVVWCLSSILSIPSLEGPSNTFGIGRNITVKRPLLSEGRIILLQIIVSKGTTYAPQPQIRIEEVT